MYPLLMQGQTLFTYVTRALLQYTCLARKEQACKLKPVFDVHVWTPQASGLICGSTSDRCVPGKSVLSQVLQGCFGQHALRICQSRGSRLRPALRTKCCRLRISSASAVQRLAPAAG